MGTMRGVFRIPCTQSQGCNRGQLRYGKASCLHWFNHYLYCYTTHPRPPKCRDLDLVVLQTPPRLAIAPQSETSPILEMTRSTWSKQEKTQSALQSESQPADPPSMLQTRSKQSDSRWSARHRAGKHELLGLFSALAVKDAAHGEWTNVTC